MSSFIRDERGVTEPYTDLPALGLVTIGLLLFGHLLFTAFSTYAETAYYMDVREDLRTIAVSIAGDQSIACDGSAFILDARKLDNMSVRLVPIKGYGRPGENVAVEVSAGSYSWQLGAINGRSASYRLPVTVRLSDARCLSGTMTVTSSEGGG